jgi:hypothetical protein
MILSAPSQGLASKLEIKAEDVKWFSHLGISSSNDSVIVLIQSAWDKWKHVPRLAAAFKYL